MVTPAAAPRASRSRFLIVTVIVPIVLVGIGLLSLWQAAALRPAADAYRAAGPCGTAPAGGSCYTLPVGTVTSVQASRNRGTVYTNLQVQLADGVYPARLSNLSDDYRGAVPPGASVQVQLYRQTITLVRVRGVWLTTSANPLVQQRQAAGGIVFLTIGAVVAALRLAVFLVQRRLRRQATVAGVQAPAAPIIPDQAGAVPVGLPFVLRPRLNELATALLVPAMSIPLLFAATYLRVRPQGDTAVLFWLVAAGLPVAVGVALWLYARNATIFVDDLNVGTTDLLGRQRVVARAEVGRIVLRTVLGVRSRNSRRILLVGSDGQVRLRIYGQFYSLDEVRTLAGVLRVPIDSDWGLGVSAGQLRTEFPGSASWLEANGYAVGVVAGLLVVAAIAIAMLGSGH